MKKLSKLFATYATIAAIILSIVCPYNVSANTSKSGPFQTSQVISNITDYYTYTLRDDTCDVELNDSFKTALNNNIPYTDSMGNVFSPGDALPNPGSTYDGKSVTGMGSMFFGCNGTTSLDLSNFDTSNVIYMGGMFSGCSKLTSLDLSSFDTSNVADMGAMFESCSSLNSLNLSGFNTSKVYVMSSMFYGCSGLTTLDLSDFNTSNVGIMENMFYGCSGLTSLDLSNFNIPNVYTTENMFYGCSSLTSLDISNFGAFCGYNASGMFYGCISLTSLDLSNFDILGIEYEKDNPDTYNFTDMLCNVQCAYTASSYSSKMNPKELYVPDKRSFSDFTYTGYIEDDDMHVIFKPYNVTVTVQGEENNFVELSSSKFSTEQYQSYFTYTKTEDYNENINYRQQGEKVTITYSLPDNTKKVDSVYINDNPIDINTYPTEYTIENVSSDIDIVVNVVPSSMSSVFENTDITDDKGNGINILCGSYKNETIKDLLFLPKINDCKITETDLPYLSISAAPTAGFDDLPGTYTDYIATDLNYNFNEGALKVSINNVLKSGIIEFTVTHIIIGSADEKLIVIIPGDVSRDGYIDSKDVIKTAGYALSDSPGGGYVNNYELELADPSKDNEIDSKDVIIISRLALGDLLINK